MRLKVLIISLIVFVLCAAAIFGYVGWFLKKQQRVANSIARPTFPYSDYSTDELNKMFPQYVNADVATTQTPEETHQKFIAALRNGDLEEAVRCCFKSAEQSDWLGDLITIKNNGKLDLMINDLSVIKQEFLGDTTASYSYSGTLDGKKVGNIISFIKNNQGVWLIESL